MDNLKTFNTMKNNSKRLLIYTFCISLLTLSMNSCSTDDSDIQDTPQTIVDSDNDGVQDSDDECPNTPTNEPVNESGCSDSQLGTDDYTFETTLNNGLYVKNGIDYGSVLFVHDNIYFFAGESGYKYSFGNNTLDFRYKVSLTYYKPYQLNNEAFNFLQEQSSVYTDESDRIHLYDTFNFDEEQDLILWKDFKFTRPIYLSDEFPRIIMFPAKKITGEDNVIDGIYEIKLIYPNNDTVKSQLYIDFQEDGYFHMTGKVFLNDSLLTQTNFTPLPESYYPALKLYKVENEVYLTPHALTQYQPIYSLHFFMKDIYQ